MARYFYSLTYLELLKHLDSTGLSPEKLAPYFGVSNMTFRRWAKKPKRQIEGHEIELVMNGLLLLVAEDRLNLDSQELKQLVRENYDSPAYFKSTVRLLKLDSWKPDGSQQLDQACLVGLNHWGKDHHKQEYVLNHIKQFKPMKAILRKVSKPLLQMASQMIEIVGSKLSYNHKLIAFGALFYLFLPFDLIPDHLPGIGYLDDLAVLGFALNHYKNGEISG